MNLLALDTSTDNASVALFVDGQFYSQNYLGAQSHAKCILPAIDELLTQTGVTFADLDGLVFGQGPGSFTGLRVACSLAKGLAYAQHLPLYPVSTLAAIREAVLFEAGSTGLRADGVLAIIDARMNQVYWSYTETATNKVYGEAVSFAKDVLIPEPALICMAGVGCERYEHDLPHAMAQRIIERRTIYPQAAAMIRLVLQGLITPVQAGEALPVYIRDQVTSPI